MSATPEHSADIADMGEYLRETYFEVERVDTMLHEMRDRIRNRLLALHLMSDAGEFGERVRIAREHAEAGKPLDGTVTPEQFATEFLATTGE
jgi:hypothetical protein